MSTSGRSTPPGERPAGSLQDAAAAGTWPAPDGRVDVVPSPRRYEVSIEVDPARRGEGLGRSLAQAAPALVPGGEPLFRCYRPIGAEVLFPKRQPTG